MLTIKAGQHCSTYGGNPLGVTIAKEAVQIIIDEKLSEKAEHLGKIFMENLKKLPKDVVSEVRGKGLFCAMVINENVNAYDVCLKLRDNGLLAKNTHVKNIRLAPPLIITEQQLNEAMEIITKTINSFK